MKDERLKKKIDRLYDLLAYFGAVDKDHFKALEGFAIVHDICKHIKELNER